MTDARDKWPAGKSDFPAECPKCGRPVRRVRRSVGLWEDSTGQMVCPFDQAGHTGPAKIQSLIEVAGQQAMDQWDGYDYQEDEVAAKLEALGWVFKPARRHYEPGQPVFSVLGIVEILAGCPEPVVRRGAGAFSLTECVTCLLCGAEGRTAASHTELCPWRLAREHQERQP